MREPTYEALAHQTICYCCLHVLLQLELMQLRISYMMFPVETSPVCGPARSKYRAKLHLGELKMST